MPLPRDRQPRGHGRAGVVEGGVEAGHLHGLRKRGGGCPDARDILRLVKRRKGHEAGEVFEHSGRHNHRAGQKLSPVHHPVADRRHTAPGERRRSVENNRDRRMPRRYVAGRHVAGKHVRRSRGRAGQILDSLTVPDQRCDPHPIVLDIAVNTSHAGGPLPGRGVEPALDAARPGVDDKDQFTGGSFTHNPAFLLVGQTQSLPDNSPSASFRQGTAPPHQG